MIELAVRKLNPLPASSARYRKTNAGIIRDGHAIAIGRIDPNVVIVSSGTAAAKASTTAATAAARTWAARDSFAAVKRDGIGIR